MLILVYLVTLPGMLAALVSWYDKYYGSGNGNLTHAPYCAEAMVQIESTGMDFFFYCCCIILPLIVFMVVVVVWMLIF